MAGFEEIAGREQSERDRIDLLGLQQLGAFEAISVARPNDAVGQVHGVAVRVVLAGWMDVDQLGGEICVDGRGRRPQLHGQRTGDLNVLEERRRPVREHVMARG